MGIINNGLDDDNGHSGHWVDADNGLSDVAKRGCPFAVVAFPLVGPEMVA